MVPRGGLPARARCGATTVWPPDDGRRAYLLRVLRAVAMPPRRIALKPQLGRAEEAEEPAHLFLSGHPYAREASLATILSVKAG